MWRDPERVTLDLLMESGMVNAFVTGIAIGAGMLAGAAGLAGAGYVAYQY